MKTPRSKRHPPGMTNVLIVYGFLGFFAGVIATEWTVNLLGPNPTLHLPNAPAGFRTIWIPVASWLYCALAAACCYSIWTFRRYSISLLVALWLSGLALFSFSYFILGSNKKGWLYGTVALAFFFILGIKGVRVVRSILTSKEHAL